MQCGKLHYTEKFVKPKFFAIPNSKFELLKKTETSIIHIARLLRYRHDTEYNPA